MNSKTRLLSSVELVRGYSVRPMRQLDHDVWFARLHSPEGTPMGNTYLGRSFTSRADCEKAILACEGTGKQGAR